MAVFPETLITERLRLRRVTVDDANEVLEYASDPEVARYMTFRRAVSLDDVLPYLMSIQEPMDTDREFHWALEVIDSPGLIGMISARRNHGLDLGYVLNRAFWGRGYMPEAVRAVIKWGFEMDGVYRVWATCDVDNEKSASVMRKVGMTDEGTLRRWEVHPNVSSEPRDSLILGIYQ